MTSWNQFSYLGVVPRQLQSEHRSLRRQPITKSASQKLLEILAFDLVSPLGKTKLTLK